MRPVAKGTVKTTYLPSQKQQGPATQYKDASAKALIRHLQTMEAGEPHKGEFDKKSFDLVQEMMMKAGVSPDYVKRSPTPPILKMEKRRFEQIALMFLTLITRVYSQDNSKLPNQGTRMEKRRKALQDARNVIAGEIEERKGFIFQSNKYQEIAEGMLCFLDIMILDFPQKKRTHKRDQYVEDCLGHLVWMFMGKDCTQKKAIEITSSILAPLGSPLAEYTPKMLEKAYYKVHPKTSPKSPR